MSPPQTSQEKTLTLCALKNALGELDGWRRTIVLRTLGGKGKLRIKLRHELSRDKGLRAQDKGVRGACPIGRLTVETRAVRTRA